MVYAICKALAYFLLRVLFGLRVEGTERVPEDGPVILASNHLSFLDPIAIGSVCPRPVAFIARADIFRYPVLSWLLPRVYAIPVERGTSDLGAVKAAIRALKEGLAFGIFPEGQRSRTGKLEPFKSGTASIAMRTGAKIVPVAITGSDKAWPVGQAPRLRRNIKVVFGDPITLPDKKLDHQGLEEVTRQLEAMVAALLPPEYVNKGNSAPVGS
ncbi:MAG: 1-acyl-sn-glycerol-3-phosphate acyltransferase [Meiothermus sp.]